MEGDGDLDGTLDRDPLSEIVPLRCLLDPPDLLLLLSSDALLNFRCMVSRKLSLFSFFFPSLDEDFPHQEGMLQD